MENIILIKTQSIEFIQGERKRDAVNIAHHAHIKIDDNEIPIINISKWFIWMNFIII